VRAAPSSAPGRGGIDLFVVVALGIATFNNDVDGSGGGGGIRQIHDRVSGGVGGGVARGLCTRAATALPSLGALRHSDSCCRFFPKVQCFIFFSLTKLAVFTELTVESSFVCTNQILVLAFLS
jgi:hypothetical protein